MGECFKWWGGKWGFLDPSVISVYVPDVEALQAVLSMNGKNFHHEPPRAGRGHVCSPAGQDHPALQEYQPGFNPRNGPVGKACEKLYCKGQVGTSHMHRVGSEAGALGHGWQLSS